jgi:Fe-S-cluster containining protein
MELGEAASLADKFMMSVLFKVHSLPLSDRSGWAGQWWRNQQSRLPLRPSLDEGRRHLGQFAARRQVDKSRDRQLFLDITATVNDDGRGQCPALAGGICSIYDVRPLTCRTVPMHYSRPPSTLQSYLDGFTSTPDYGCDTTDSAPVLLDGNRVIDAQIQADREKAALQARQDRRWKARIVAMMDDDFQADSVDLPTYAAVINNSDGGHATLLPMIVAWRVAVIDGSLSQEAFRAICENQARLFKNAIAAHEAGPAPKYLRDSLAVYRHELSKAPIPTDQGAGARAPGP